MRHRVKNVRRSTTIVTLCQQILTLSAKIVAHYALTLTHKHIFITTKSFHSWHQLQKLPLELK
jgi:hypothetical protein